MYGSKTYYVYNSCNQLTQETENDEIGGGQRIYVLNYDSAGNLTSETKNNAAYKSYTYDALNRVASFANSSNIITKYTYNAQGQRTEKSTGSNYLTSIWLGGMIADNIPTSDTVGTFGNNDQIFLNGEDGNDGMLYNGVWTAHVTDASGSTLANVSGITPSPVNFDAYGNMTSGQAMSSITNPYTYDGYYQDYESGLYYLNARYYDPTTQQFTQEDPAQDGTNWYGYCGGDPVNFADPTGCSSYPGQCLRRGSSGDYVLALQIMLNAFLYYYSGFTPLALDGKFGPATQAAVKLFQSTHADLGGTQLATDGVVGAKTWGAIFDAPSASYECINVSYINSVVQNNSNSSSSESNKNNTARILFLWWLLGPFGLLTSCDAQPSSSSTAPTTTTTTVTTTVITTDTTSVLKTYIDYLNALGMMESSDNYSAKNKYGYLGRYQMGSLALQDAGFMDSKGNWTATAKTYGVTSESTFLGNKTAQDVAITAFNKKQWGYIKYYGLDKYIGGLYCGVTVTASGLLAAVHLVGIGTILKALPSGVSAKDANGTTAAFYMQKFGGYDITCLY